jgi:hypothetical protein|tara:strand:- start:24 stop:533 length:510 start_codon:yes stop_codon:yes gene_type:complete
MTEEINFKAICNLTTNVMGLPDGSLALKSRKRLLQSSRSIAAYIGLTEEDIHRNVIAKVLNRDRAVTYHYESKHKKNFKHCIIYRKTFEKIYAAYKDLDGSKKIFLDKDFLRSHLLQNGVTEVLKSDVLLEVKSGSVKYNVKTCYFDFSNQLENVKIAMKNYHYSIKIK